MVKCLKIIRRLEPTPHELDVGREDTQTNTLTFTPVVNLVSILQPTWAACVSTAEGKCPEETEVNVGRNTQTLKRKGVRFVSFLQRSDSVNHQTSVFKILKYIFRDLASVRFIINVIL